MKLTSGKMTLPVERDGLCVGEISFDPQDIGFAQSFCDLMEGLTTREQEYRGLENSDVGERLRQLRMLCAWLREQVERVFGPGSAEVLFGSSCSLELFRQFFEGVEPYIRAGRAKKTAKYRTADTGVME